MNLQDTPGIVFTPSKFTPVMITMLQIDGTPVRGSQATRDMFVDGVLPQVGDAIEMVVYERRDTETQIELAVKFRVKR